MIDYFRDEDDEGEEVQEEDGEDMQAIKDAFLLPLEYFFPEEDDGHPPSHHATTSSAWNDNLHGVFELHLWTTVGGARSGSSGPLDSIHLP